MQEVLNNNDLSTEFSILESLLEEQNTHGDQYTIPVKTFGNLRDYVKASDVILILFDHENPGWANKKLLGNGSGWKSETAFLVTDSILCSSMTEDITFVRYDSEADSNFDPAINAEIISPVRNL